MATTPGLEALRSAAIDPARLEEALFSRAKMDIDQQKADYIRQQEESANARGVRRGIGVADYLTSLRTDAEGKFAQALEKARLDAYTASQKAQLAALSDVAAKEATHRGMDVQEQGQKRALKSAKSGQMMQAGAGIGGAALGTIGNVFKDDIKGGLRGMLGAGGSTAGGVRDLGTYAGGRPDLSNLMPGMPDAASIDTAPDFGMEDMNLSVGSSMPDFQMPDLDFDLSSLFGGSSGADDEWIKNLFSSMA